MAVRAPAMQCRLFHSSRSPSDLICCRLLLMNPPPLSRILKLSSINAQPIDTKPGFFRPLRSTSLPALLQPSSSHAHTPRLCRGFGTRPLEFRPQNVCRDAFRTPRRSLATKTDKPPLKSPNTAPPSPGRTPLPNPIPSAIRSRLTATPHENIYTVPNILTFSRLLSAPLIGYCILDSHPIAALSLFVYAGVTDALDGYLARHLRQQTVVGTVIDPMADKALMTISIICLAVQNTIPLWLASLILGRDVGLGISAIYYRYISLPPPRTFTRYWDFSLPSAEVHPTEISKWNTFLQLCLVGAGLALPVLPVEMVSASHLTQGFVGLQWVVAGTTVWSGASYVYSKDAVKILTHEEIEERMKAKENEKR